MRQVTDLIEKLAQDNPALHGYDQNRIWFALIALASELVARLQMLTIAGHPAAGGNPTASGCGCCPPPDDSPPPGDASCSTAAPGDGADCSCRPSPDFAPLPGPAG